MIMQDFLGAFPLQRFLAEHLHRLPLALPGVCEDVREFGTWARLAPLLAAPAADVLVVQQGAQHAGPSPTDVDSAQALCASGHTLVIRHTERHDSEIARLAAVFAETLRAPVNVHMYATPP